MVLVVGELDQSLYRYILVLLKIVGFRDCAKRSFPNNLLNGIVATFEYRLPLPELGLGERRHAPLFHLRREIREGASAASLGVVAGAGSLVVAIQ